MLRKNCISISAWLMLGGIGRLWGLAINNVFQTSECANQGNVRSHLFGLRQQRRRLARRYKVRHSYSA